MIKHETFVNKLVSRLPNFYKDYIYDPAFLKELFDAYIEAVGIITNYANIVYANTTINTAELNHVIDKKVVSLTNSLYDVNAVATLFKASTGKEWFSGTTTQKEKLAFLTTLGKYEDLNDIDNSGLIVGTSIRKDFSGVLGSYAPAKDFVISDKKLYMFNELAKPPIEHPSIKQVLFEDMKITRSKLKNRWGVFFPTINDAYIGQYEYRNLLSSLLKYDSTLHSMQDIIKTININSNAYIKDKYSRRNVPDSSLWAENEIGPFEFIFNLPVDLLVSMAYTPSGVTSTEDTESLQGRMNNIIAFFRTMKPAYTSFFLKGDMPINEVFYGTEQVDKVYWALSSPYTTTYSPTDTVSFKTTVQTSEDPVGPDSMFAEPPATYGSVFYDDVTYDGNMVRDLVLLKLN